MNVKLIDRELVLAIHDRHLAEHGGAPGVRDEALTCAMFIESNGGKPEAHDADLFPLVLALADGRLSAEELRGSLRSDLRVIGVHPLWCAGTRIGGAQAAAPESAVTPTTQASNSRSRASA